MAYEELFKKIKDYESKWGKLGAGNSILNPEKTTISHSGLNNSNDFYGGKRKMLNMTNDYYEFRRKVAEGKNKNKLAHAATVDIDEINRQHWERINSDGILIHVGGRYGSASSYNDNNEDDDYLEHVDRNVKYYQKIKLPNGETRYFYTREEWDAYQNGQKQSEAESKRNANGTMKDTAKRALEIPMRTTKDIIKSNQAAQKNAQKNSEAAGITRTNSEGESYRTYESDRTKKEITGPNATKSKRIKHSFEDDDMNESIMSEYRAFKARANRGAEMNRLSHSSFISPSELNERYEEEIASHCFLAHAGGYGAPSGTNAYVAKIDDFYGKGKPRYFYSREEYDAYQRNAKGAQNAEKDRAKKEKANNTTYTNKLSNDTLDFIEKQKQKKANYDKNAEAASKAGADRANSESQSAKNVKKNTESFTPNTDPGDPEYNANARRSGLAAEKERENAGKQTQYGSDAYPVVPENIKNAENAKDIDDYMESSEMRSYIAQAIKEAINKHITRGHAWTSVESKNKDVLAKLNDKDIKKNIINELRLFGLAGEKSPNHDYIMKVFKRAINKEYEHQMNLLQSQVDTDERKKENNNVQHSALDELNEFKARVAMGKEKNRLAHSRMISLTELQHAASGGYGAPSGTNKYYAKLDDFYGKGKPRYFYTKEEWDGYQRNAKGASQAGADRAQKEKNNNTPYDNKLSQDTLDFIQEQKMKKQNYDNNAKAAQHEGDRYKNEEAQRKLKKSLEENYRKNMEAAKHEGDRWAKTITESSKVIDAPGKDIEKKPENTQPPVQMEEEVKQEVKQETMPKDTAYTNVLNNILNDQNINDWAYICAIRSVYGANEDNEKAVWELQSYLDNVLNQVYTEIGSMYGEAAINEIDGIIGEQLQMLYQNYYNMVFNEFNQLAIQQAQQQNMWNMMNGF